MALMFSATFSAIFLVGCDSDPNRLFVERIIINTPASLDDASADREGLRERVRDYLSKNQQVVFKKRKEPPSLILTLSLVENARGEQSGEDRVIKISVADGLHPQLYSAVGYSPVSKSWSNDAFTGFKDAWLITMKMREWDQAASSELLITALSDPDPRLRRFAVSRIAEAKLKDAVPVLIKRLGEEGDQTLVLRIIGALSEIGDPRAASALINLTRRQDPIFIMQVVYALGTIGGPTAEGYLVTLASGHPNRAVRHAATEVLGALGHDTKVGSSGLTQEPEQDSNKSK